MSCVISWQDFACGLYIVSSLVTVMLLLHCYCLCHLTAQPEHELMCVSQVMQRNWLGEVGSNSVNQGRSSSEGKGTVQNVL